MNGWLSGKGGRAARAGIWLLALVWLGLAWPARAQSVAPVIVANEAEPDFPRALTFRLRLENAGTFSAARLFFDTERFTCVDTVTEVPLDEIDDTLEWTWAFARSGNPPPGARVRWWWALDTADGQTHTTPVQEITLNDDRFRWQTLHADQITVHWYDDQTVAEKVLQAAVAGIDHLNDLLGIPLQEPVQLFIYESSEVMRDAILYRQDWAGAVAFSDYNTILLGTNRQNIDSWGVPTVRHELAHLVIGQFGRSCAGGSRPTWLEEGLAVLAEGEPDSFIRRQLDDALAQNAFEPVRSLNGAFSAHGDLAGVAYAQSFSLVDYLYTVHGPDKLRQLIRTLAEGATYDEALEAVYGFNSDGLELAWREYIGAPPRPIPPTPTPIRAEAIPTMPPLVVAAIQPTPPAAAQPPANKPRSTVCGLGLIPLLGLLWLGRKRQARTGD